MDNDETPDPKPLVSFAFLPEDEKDKKPPDVLEQYIKEYYSKNKTPIDFGETKQLVNDEIKQKINVYHKFKEPSKTIGYDDSEEDSNMIGPQVPEEYQRKDSLSSSDKSNKDNEDDYSSLPISHMVELIHTKDKALTSLDINRSDLLLATGSQDGTVKIWDFNSLKRNPEANHTIDAGMEYPVVSVSWAPSGGFLLACTGDCQAKVLSPNGIKEISCLKGDSYLHDISNTKGHTFPLTDGKWHPNDRRYFITSSIDSTIRIWDINSRPQGIDSELMQSRILKPKTFKNRKVPISSCNYSPDGQLIIGGVNDGSIQLWTDKSSIPERINKTAHSEGTTITSVLFAEDNRTFYSRGDDSTMKMWDIRRHEKVLHVWDNIGCFSSKTGICLSPENDIVITGTSVKKGADVSHLMFYSTYDYHLIKDIKICLSSITSIIWRQKLNQIGVCSTDGSCRMFYNPKLSKGGVVNLLYKLKKKEVDDFQYAQPIITPLVLPFTEEINFDRETYLNIIKPDDPEKQSADLPTHGPFSKFTRNPSVTQHVMRNLNKAIYKDDDSRSVLLAFDSKGKSGEWVESAYQKTQPNLILDYKANLEDEVKFYENIKKKMCPNCGLKLCTCKRNNFQIPISKLTTKKKK